MKRVWTTIVAVSLLLALAAAPARAGCDECWCAADAYDDTQGHPLRLAAFLVYPVGFLAEYLVARPFHSLVSQPGLNRFFGHERHSDDVKIGQTY